MPRYRKENAEQYLQSLAPQLKQPIEQLRLLQKKCDSLKEEYDREVKALKARYKKLYDPVYDTRARVIRGKTNGNVFSVPGFWLKVFLSSATVGSTIRPKDEEVLKFLCDVRSEPVSSDKNGFHLIFTFERNPYFSNEKLKKTYFLGEEEESLLVSSKGCEIDWNPDRNPSLETVWKRGKQTVVETESFFDFFSPPELPATDASGDVNLEQIHEIQEAIEEDFDVGLVVKDMLVPNAVSWFTGEIVEESSSEEGSSVEGSVSEGS